MTKPVMMIEALEALKDEVARSRDDLFPLMPSAVDSKQVCNAINRAKVLELVEPVALRHTEPGGRRTKYRITPAGLAYLTQPEGQTAKPEPGPGPLDDQAAALEETREEGLARVMASNPGGFPVGAVPSPEIGDDHSPSPANPRMKSQAERAHTAQGSAAYGLPDPAPFVRPDPVLSSLAESRDAAHEALEVYMERLNDPVLVSLVDMCFQAEQTEHTYRLIGADHAR